MLNDEIREQAEKAIKNPIVLKDLLDDLCGTSRRNRQYAASTLSVTAKLNPETLIPYIGDLFDALELSEAQTRWECLDALSYMVAVAPDACREAIPGAEAALFDENNGLLHLSAMRFLCALAVVSHESSVELWPLIDEGIQCYHGDIEFSEMLTQVTMLSESDIDPFVKSALAARMAFDAANSRGSLKRRAQQIIDNCSK